MDVTVGVFDRRLDAQRAVERLTREGVSTESVIVLTPDASPGEVQAVPTDDAEAPGMGAAVGGVAGGATGVFGATALGPVISVVVPGIGPIAALGAGAMALLAALGAAVGAAAGSVLEHTLSEGLPRDQLEVYRQHLNRGRTVVAVQSDQSGTEAAREVLQAAGGAVDVADEQAAAGAGER